MKESMKKKLIFHIGTPKTGTTSIQTFLDMNRARLAKHGIVYPDTRQFCETNGIDIGNSSAYIQNGGFFEHYIPLGISNIDMDHLLKDEDFLRIMEYILESFENADTVILSDESMWLRNITQLLEFFLNHNVEVYILVYFRNQIDYIESFWKHDIKIGNYTGSFDRFLEERAKSNIVRSMYYCSRLNAIEKIVSRENIIARIYDPENHKGDKNWLIDDFLCAAGIPGAFDWVYPEEYQNKSLYGNTLMLKNSFNELGVGDFAGYFWRVFQGMAEIEAKENPRICRTTFINRELQDRLIGQFKSENKDLRDRFFPNEKEALFVYEDKEVLVWKEFAIDKNMLRFIIAYGIAEIDYLKSINEKLNRIEQILKGADADAVQSDKKE